MKSNLLFIKEQLLQQHKLYGKTVLDSIVKENKAPSEILDNTEIYRTKESRAKSHDSSIKTSISGMLQL